MSWQYLLSCQTLPRRLSLSVEIAGNVFNDIEANFIYCGDVYVGTILYVCSVLTLASTAQVQFNLELCRPRLNVRSITG